MIFTNPAGAPELACDECGCRWFDRMGGACYECGAEVGADARAEYEAALRAFAARRAQGGGPDQGEAAGSRRPPVPGGA